MENHVVTIGDPGLATSGEKNIASLYNQYDIVYGMVAEPTGVQYSVSKWWQYYGHMSYGKSLKDEANAAKGAMKFKFV